MIITPDSGVNRLKKEKEKKKGKKNKKIQRVKGFYECFLKRGRKREMPNEKGFSIVSWISWLLTYDNR